MKKTPFGECVPTTLGKSKKGSVKSYCDSSMCIFVYDIHDRLEFEDKKR